MASSTFTSDALGLKILVKLEMEVWREAGGTAAAGFVQSLAATAAPLLSLVHDMALRMDAGRARDEVMEGLRILMDLVRRMSDAVERDIRFVPDPRDTALILGNAFPGHVSQMHAVCLGTALRAFVNTNWPGVLPDVSSWVELASVLEIKRLLARLFGENCLGLPRWVVEYPNSSKDE